MQKNKETGLGLEGHLLDTTAILAESTPIFAAFEVGVAGLSNAVSFNTRLGAAILSYFGLGKIFAGGRDMSKKIFGIDGTTIEKKRAFHDTVYNAAFTVAISPPMYAVSQKIAGQDIDVGDLAMGTLVATGLSMVNGAPLGYAIDVVRDLSGRQTCLRPTYPESIRKLSPTVKKTLLAGIVATSIIATAGVYAANNYLSKNLIESESISNDEK